MFDGEGNGDWCLVFGDAEEDLALRRFGVAELWDDLRKNDRFFQISVEWIRFVCPWSVCRLSVRFFLSFFMVGMI